MKATKKDGYALTCDISPDRDALLSQIDEAIKTAGENAGGQLFEIKGEEVIVNLYHGVTYNREKIAVT